MISLNRNRLFRTILIHLAGAMLACGNTRAGNTSYSGDGPVTAVQPVVSEIAFVSSGAGTEVKLAGSSPSGQLSLVRVTLFDDSGTAIRTDTNGDGSPDATTMEFAAGQVVENDEFFIDLTLSQAVSSDAAKMGVQVVDQYGAESAITYANLDDVPELAQGDACDLRGFYACPAGSTCAKSANDWQAHCMSAGAQ